MDKNPSRDLGLAEILEKCRPEYERELARQTEIAEKARKVGLIFGEYRDVLRQFRGTEDLRLDELRFSVPRPDLDVVLSTLVSEGILKEKEGVYQPTKFADTFVHGYWGRELDFRK